MKKYKRTSLLVEAVKYEPDKGLEDGFFPWSSVVTNGWIVADKILQIKYPNGQIMCPFVRNRRGIIFIREGDYIIYEESGEKHCCGGDKFDGRFQECQE